MRRSAIWRWRMIFVGRAQEGGFAERNAMIHRGSRLALSPTDPGGSRLLSQR